MEETLIKPVIKGIIRLDYGSYSNKNCLRCIYYAEPVDQEQRPKEREDEHTSSASFLTIEEILSLRSKWRGS